MSFLQTGTTRREDVLTQLHLIDTTCSNPRLFWGRWSESKWGYWWCARKTCLTLQTLLEIGTLRQLTNPA
jgi:hypothetical protein